VKKLTCESRMLMAGVAVETLLSVIAVVVVVVVVGCERLVEVIVVKVVVIAAAAAVVVVVVVAAAMTMMMVDIMLAMVHKRHSLGCVAACAHRVGVVAHNVRDARGVLHEACERVGVIFCIPGGIVGC
jgi:hypothetical protein